MRQLSHCSHRHVNSTFLSLTEDFINEYGSKFLDSHSGSIFNSVENAHYFPFYIRYKFKEFNTSSCESIHINASKISIKKPRFLNIASVVM